MSRRTRTTHVIDANQPIALLDVSNTLDNSAYRWCADEVMDDDGRWLRDDELTYNDFMYGPEHVLPAGTKVRMDYLWGWKAEGQTDVVDYEITLPEAATLEHVVYVILSVYHGQVEAEEEGSGRFYFIEAVEKDEDGVFHIHFGT